MEHKNLYSHLLSEQIGSRSIVYQEGGTKALVVQFYLTGSEEIVMRFHSYQFLGLFFFLEIKMK